MSGIITPSVPVTQTIESGKALAKFLGLSEELPEMITLAGSARLVLSSKRDAYYVTTTDSCSCKAGQYGRICKHRKPEGNQPSKAAIYQARQREMRTRARVGLSGPVDSIKPTESWANGYNGPVEVV